MKWLLLRTRLFCYTELTRHRLSGNGRATFHAPCRPLIPFSTRVHWYSYLFAFIVSLMSSCIVVTPTTNSIQNFHIHSETVHFSVYISVRERRNDNVIKCFAFVCIYFIYIYSVEIWCVVNMKRGVISAYFTVKISSMSQFTIPI